jgi:hypothetical protein
LAIEGIEFVRAIDGDKGQRTVVFVAEILHG